jgi:hypothetical protein
MELKNKISHFMDLISRDYIVFRGIKEDYGIKLVDSCAMSDEVKKLEKLIFEEWFKGEKREAWIDGKLEDLFEVIRSEAIEEVLSAEREKEREKFCEKMETSMKSPKGSWISTIPYTIDCTGTSVVN